ncbi:MAG: UDP-N-acetylmuramoyl-L-alanine--D-glutamate ligase [Sulfuricellaceae bacterium]
MELKNKNILVLGLGDTGLSLARRLVLRGARVTVADSRVAPPHVERLRAELPDVVLVTGPYRPEEFIAAEIIAISPGVPLAEPLVATAIARGVPVVGDIELFARQIRGQKTEDRRQKNHLEVCPLSSVLCPLVIAITGSNGKSTVTEMVGAMCRKAGLNTVVAGNIGLPVLDALTAAERDGSAPDVYVLELSSFQLETTSSLNPTAATVLNVTEDHLDRYSGMTDYAAAKARIFAGSGAQVLNRQDAWSSGMAAAGRNIVTFGLDAPRNDHEWGLRQIDGATWLARGAENLMALRELPLAGLHNAANALAALALCDMAGLATQPLLAALREFQGLPHRVAKVAEINGVTYYDDSKGTNVGATVAGIRGQKTEDRGQKTVLIAGGDGKGQDFSPLRAAVESCARAVILIGRDAPKIEAALLGCGVPLLNSATLEQAVTLAAEQAQPGDAVLLSPACASWDMFRNYEHRAEVFIAAVQQLSEDKRQNANGETSSAKSVL